MNKSYIGDSSLASCLRRLGLSSTIKTEQKYGVLFIGSKEKQIILLRKESSFGEFYHNPPYAPFSSITYFRERVAQWGLNRLSEREIGILRIATDESDRGSIDDFWNGKELVVKKTAYKIMRNEFISSPNIEEGFCFRSKGLTIRGHSRNLQSERAFLEETKLQLNVMAESFKGCIFQVPSFSQHNLHRFFANFPGKLEEIKKAKLKIEEGPDRELDELFLELEKIVSLRACPPNEDIRKQIKSAKDAVWAKGIAIQREFCGLGFTSSQMGQNLEIIKKNLKELQQQTQALELLLIRNIEFKRWESLNRVYLKEIGDLMYTIVEDQISSAQGWVIRLYSEKPIKEPDEVKHSLWQVLAELMSVRHNPDIDEKLYLFNSDYREKLLTLLEEEIKFDQEFLDPSSEKIKRDEEAFDTLKKLHSYWNTFKKLDRSPIFLNTARQHEEEVFSHVKSYLSEHFGSLSCQLISPTPNLHRVAQEHLNRTLLILIKKMRLEEEKFQLGGRVVKDESGVIFHDSEYAKVRIVQDPIIYKLATLMIVLLAESGSPFEEVIVSIVQVASDFICKSRYYGPQKKRIEFLTTSEDLASHLKKLISQLSDVQELLENPSKRVMRKILENLKKSSKDWEKTSKEFNVLLKEFPKNAEWWQKCIVLATKIKKKVAELEGVSKDIDTITIDTLNEEAFVADKEEFRRKLIDLNKTLGKRAPLKVAINSLLPMLIDNEKAIKIHPKLRKAREQIASLAQELNRASGFSTLDCSIRSRAESKIEELQAVFAENTTSEFFTRTKTVRDLINGDPSLKELADKVLLGAKIKLLTEEQKRAITMGQSISIVMKRCEWSTDRNSIATHYSWLGSNISEDPHYRAKATHIAI